MQRLLWTLLAVSLSSPLYAEDWPQWMGPKRDSIWRETGILEAFPKDGPKVLWRMPVSGGFAGPAVAAGKVYVSDYVTTDNVKAEVFDRTDFKGKERLLCLDATTGKEIWKYEYDCKYTVSYPIGPRCTPTVSGGKVYFLGTEGNFACLDAAKGTVLWAKDFQKEYTTKTALWGYCSHPLVDGDTVYCVVGGEGSCAVAFNKDTGKEIWRSLTAEEQGYCPPTMIEAGGKKQLLIWHATSLNSLDPATGKKYWSVLIQANYKMSIMTPRKSDDLLYVGGEGGKGVMMKLDADKPDAKEFWRSKKGESLHPINMTPFIEGAHMYGVDEKGSLMCVELQTGKRVWQSNEPFDGKPNAAGTAFIVKNEERFFLFTEKGDLIIAKMSPKGYEQLSKAKIIEPTTTAFRRDVVWTHPAFANQCIYVRNDKEIVCLSLKK